MDSDTPSKPCLTTRAGLRAQRSANQPQGTMTRNMPSSSRRPSGPQDWLPNKQPNSTLANKVRRGANIEAHRRCDWFLSYAAIMEKKDSAQSTMFTKLYLFLHDFIPRGLVNGLSHIHGNSVMDQLLSHPTEKFPSRHKVTKSAEAAFTELERWMGKCATWQEALKKAKDKALADRSRSQKKKQQAGRAPGLHSPAGTSLCL